MDLKKRLLARLDLLVVGRRIADVDPGGYPGAGFIDVDMIEQVVIHEVPIALIVGTVQADVLVQVEAGSVFERNLPRLVEPDQLRIETERSGAGGTAQDGVGLALQESDILLSSHGRDVLGRIDDNFHRKPP